MSVDRGYLGALVTAIYAQGGIYAIGRMEIIQMMDLPRWHYEVWCDFEEGDCELLEGKGNEDHYIPGLRSAVRLAREKWGDVPVELCRYRHRRCPIIIAGSRHATNMEMA